MQSVRGLGAARAAQRGWCRQRAGFGLLLGLAAAGCTTTGQTPGTLADVRGTAIAIESIEGASPQVFHRLERALDAEASAHQLVVVPSGGTAAYRLRGYLAAHTEQTPAAIAWAWDIYDAGERWVFRLSGEERTAAGRRSWAAADDAVLRRIARAGMDQFVAFIASAPVPARPIPEPAPGVATVSERATALAHGGAGR